MRKSTTETTKRVDPPDENTYSERSFSSSDRREWAVVLGGLLSVCRVRRFLSLPGSTPIPRHLTRVMILGFTMPLKMPQWGLRNLSTLGRYCRLFWRLKADCQARENRVRPCRAGVARGLA